MTDVGGIPVVTTGHNDNGFGGNGIWAILLLALLGRRGFGDGDGGHGNNFGCCKPATCEDVTQNAQFVELNGRFNEMDARFNQQQNNTMMQAILDKECSINDNVSQQSYNLNNSIKDGNYGLMSAVDRNRFDTAIEFKNAELRAADCCCITNRNIDSVKFENSQNTGRIIENATANTQKILDKMCANEINELRDKLAESRLTTSQLMQNATIIGALSPKCPVPAYPVHPPTPAFHTQSFVNCEPRRDGRFDGGCGEF